MYDTSIVLEIITHFYKIEKDNRIVVIIIFVNVISMIVQFIKFVL